MEEGCVQHNNPTGSPHERVTKDGKKELCMSLASLLLQGWKQLCMKVPLIPAAPLSLSTWDKILPGLESSAYLVPTRMK